MNSTWSEQQKAKTEVKEQNKVRKEKLAGLFFDLAKLTYTALVLGAIVLLFQSDEMTLKLSLMLAFGVILAFAWGEIGNNILK